MCSQVQSEINDSKASAKMTSQKGKQRKRSPKDEFDREPKHD